MCLLKCSVGVAPFRTFPFTHNHSANLASVSPAMSTGLDPKSGAVLIVSDEQHRGSQVLAPSAPGALTSFGTVERATMSIAGKMSKLADNLARKHAKWGVDIPVKDIQDVLADLARDGQGKEDRVLLLRTLREQVGGLPTLVDPCQRLMAYTLP
jgi:hypothetical protein